MNETIKGYAKISRVKLWQVAEVLGLQDSNFSKKLRHKLTPADEQRICEIIDMIAAKQETKEDTENEE